MVFRYIPIAAAVLCFSSSARVSRKSGGDGSKFIAGVPVLNYDSIAAAKEVTSSGADSVEWDRWNVVLKPWASTEIISKFCDMQGKGVCMLTGNPSKGGFAYIAVQLPEKSMEAAVRALKAYGADIVKYLEPDTEVKMVPDFEVSPARSWGLAKVGVSESTAKGTGVNVYVLDTGIRTSHVDFGGRAFPALDIENYGGDQMCDESATDCAVDNQGHGTHCAGTVGGESFGVAPKAKIFAGKVLGDSGSGSWSWIYSALNLVVTEGHKPAVVSMSLGGGGNKNGMKNAVEAAVDAGVVVVVAGGNENSDACGFSPAFVPSAITVGSTDSQDTRSSFSNFGGCIDIWAPGSDITSADHNSSDGNKTLSGTSMACPHVSGAAALILESNSNFSPAQVMETLLGDSYKGVVSGLKDIDLRNNLLWVGDGEAPFLPPGIPEKTISCPSYAESLTPDRDGDCQCRVGVCSRAGGDTNCPCSCGPGGCGGRYFYPTCTDCFCG